jgi:hypothetical protein
LAGVARGGGFGTGGAASLAAAGAGGAGAGAGAAVSAAGSALDTALGADSGAASGATAAAALGVFSCAGAVALLTPRASEPRWERMSSARVSCSLPYSVNITAYVPSAFWHSTCAQTP